MANGKNGQFIGNLGHDAEFIQTQTGFFLCKFSVLVKQRRTEEGMVIKVTAFNKRAEVTGGLFDSGALRRGSSVYVSGALEENKFVRADGTNGSNLGLSTNEIQVPVSRDGAQASQTQYSPEAQYTPPQQQMAPVLQHAPNQQAQALPQAPYESNNYGQS